MVHIEEGPAGIARVRTYFYPHWVATEEGRSLSTSAAPDGILLIAVPPHAADIEVVFREPGRVRTAALVSTIAWISLAALAVFGWLPRANRTPKELSSA